MKRKNKHIRKGIITSLFLLILGGIIVNSTFFLHAHKNESGKIIFHAHPFDKGAEKEDPCAKHGHNRIDLNHLSSFDHYTVFGNDINLNFNREFEIEILSKPCDISGSDILDLFTTRGPPSELLLG